jgi:hypothetical protein
MKKFVLIGLMLTSLFIFSCQEKPSMVIDLMPIEKFSDQKFDYFLSNVSSLEFNNDTYYLSEYEFSRVLLLNKDYSLKLLIDDRNGDLGISYPTYTLPILNKIAVYSAGKHKIDFFTHEGELIDSLSIKVTSELLNFAPIDDKLVYSILPEDLEGQFKIHSLIDKENRRFGELTKMQNNNFQKLYNSKSYIFPYQDKFITLAPTTGELSIYNSSGEVTFNSNLLDLLGLEIVKEEIENFYKSKGSSTMDIASDCKILENRIYILMYDRRPEAKPNPREVVVLKINENNKIVYEKTFNLGDPESYYSKICLTSPKQLAAFELVTSDIHIFNLVE